MKIYVGGRRSSFSHNRYLEDVKKCSKPGSVTEKAILRDQIRKKGLFALCEPNFQVSNNEVSEKRCYDDEFSHTHLLKHGEGMDSSMYGSTHRMREQEGEVSDLSSLDAQIEYSVGKGEHCDKPEYVISTDSRLETKAKENVSNPTIGLPSDNHGTKR